MPQWTALVIPGGESTTMWKLAIAFEIAEPLRKRLSGGMPAFGSCAGMIMLADRLLDGVDGQETLGGIGMTVRRNAFGRQVDSFESDICLDRDRESPGASVSCRVHQGALGGGGQRPGDRSRHRACHR